MSKKDEAGHFFYYYQKRLANIIYNYSEKSACKHDSDSMAGGDRICKPRSNHNAGRDKVCEPCSNHKADRAGFCEPHSDNRAFLVTQVTRGMSPEAGDMYPKAGSPGVNQGTLHFLTRTNCRKKVNSIGIFIRKIRKSRDFNELHIN